MLQGTSSRTSALIESALHRFRQVDSHLTLVGALSMATTVGRVSRLFLNTGIQRAGLSVGKTFLARAVGQVGVIGVESLAFSTGHILSAGLLGGGYHFDQFGEQTVRGAEVMAVLGVMGSLTGGLFRTVHGVNALNQVTRFHGYASVHQRVIHSLGEGLGLLGLSRYQHPESSWMHSLIGTGETLLGLKVARGISRGLMPGLEEGLSRLDARVHAAYRQAMARGFRNIPRFTGPSPWQPATAASGRGGGAMPQLPALKRDGIDREHFIATMGNYSRRAGRRKHRIVIEDLTKVPDPLGQVERLIKEMEGNQGLPTNRAALETKIRTQMHRALVGISEAWKQDRAALQKIDKKGIVPEVKAAAFAEFLAIYSNHLSSLSLYIIGIERQGPIPEALEAAKESISIWRMQRARLPDLGISYADFSRFRSKGKDLVRDNAPLETIKFQAKSTDEANRLIIWADRLLEEGRVAEARHCVHGAYLYVYQQMNEAMTLSTTFRSKLQKLLEENPKDPDLQLAWIKFEFHRHTLNSIRRSLTGVEERQDAAQIERLEGMGWQAKEQLDSLGHVTEFFDALAKLYSQKTSQQKD